MPPAVPDTSSPPDPPFWAIASKLNWLRAGVSGANDGIVSTAALIFGEDRRS